MPELPTAPGESFGDLFVKVGRLWLDPSSLEATEHLVKGWRGATTHAVLEYATSEEVTLSRQDLDDVAHAIPGQVPLGRRFKHLMYDWMTAGHVLVYTLRLARYHPRLASAATAMRILERRYTKEGEAASPRSIKGAGLRYRPVAHLVAAAVQVLASSATNRFFASLVTVPGDGAQAMAFAPDATARIVANAGEVERFITDANNTLLPQFFAVAEAFRRAGEAHYATGQDVHGNSLLDPETSWRLPAAIPLPRGEIELPPLDPDEVTAASVK